MASNSWEEFGQCRCCLKEGNHRDMMREYQRNGVREAYHNMITECFNLLLSTDTRLTTLICAACVHQVRQASSFRLMVTESEQELLSCIRNQETIFVDVPAEDPIHTEVDIKCDNIEIKEENNALDADWWDYDETNSDEPGMGEESEIEGKSALLARWGDRAAPLPSREDLYTVYPEFATQLELFKNTKVTSKTVENLLQDAENQSKNIIKSAHSRYLCLTEKAGLIANSLTLLENSTLIPFKSRQRSGFPCFYCKKSYELLDKLKEHQTKTHSKKELRKLISQYSSETLVIYVDVTDLKCTICNDKIPNINELKLHLTKIHKKVYDKEYTDRVVPFKLTESNVYECQNCKFSFETFGAIERHMSSHYRNYVCKECGNGFVTKYRLKVHIKNMHISGTHTCEECNKIFQTPIKLKSHVATVHKLFKRFKCSKCPERFAEYFKRQKHMVIEHGVAPLRYQCKCCDKSFDRKYILSRHMKRDHLEERDFQCEVCSYKCFSSNELRVHSIKHTGERIFECAVCKKSYARKKTLREHMRIHNNDRRFTCDVCGQAFVQKCSLKGHMKTHHNEYGALDTKMDTEFVGGRRSR